MWIVRFLFGCAAGSFLNVLATRYDPDKFLLSGNVIGGRSHCPKCGTTLKWYELVPLLSFMAQRGKCRTCRAPISFQYPIVEIISGLIFVLVPGAVRTTFPLSAFPALLSALWILVFLTLFLIALIDIRLRLIPDETNIFLIFLGFARLALALKDVRLPAHSLLDPYQYIFGFQGSPWIIHGIGFAVGFFIFAFLILISRGRGMGMGDLKLAAALGLIFGWPDILILCALAFITGSLVGVSMIIAGKKKLKSLLPFGPFLVFAAALVFMFGAPIMKFYFSLFPAL